MRMRVLIIDPGRSAGWSYSYLNAIIGCGLVHPHKKCEHIPIAPSYVDVVGVELPTDYRDGKSASLIKLAITIGWLTDPYRMAGVPIEYVEPREWKGNLSKDVCWHRAQGKLTTHELEMVKAVTQQHAKLDDLQDAIALNLWWMKHREGRFDR